MTTSVGRGIAGALLLLLGVAAHGSAADPEEAGRAAYARGDVAAAERLFREALGERPRSAALHYQHAVALTRLGRLGEAADAYRTSLRYEPSADLAAAAREGLRRIAPLTPPRAATASTDSREISLQRSRGGWFAEVTLPDGRTGRFLVDTGASVCVVSPKIATALGLDVDGAEVALQTVGGRISAPLVTLASLRVGDHEARSVRAVVHYVPGMDGILGNSFLERFVATVDPRRGVLLLEPR